MAFSAEEHAAIEINSAKVARIEPRVLIFILEVGMMPFNATLTIARHVPRSDKLSGAGLG